MNIICNSNVTFKTELNTIFIGNFMCNMYS